MAQNQWQRNEIPKHPDGKMLSWSQIGGAHPSMPIVTSFFTDQFYLRDAYDLARSCIRYGLDFVIEQVPPLGTWEQNTSYKPTFLLQIANRFKDRSLLWLDADARIRKFPHLLRDLDTHIAFHTWDASPASGTVYLTKNWDKKQEILNYWINACKRTPGLWDQVCMGIALKELGYRHYELPVEYCWIFDQDPLNSGTRILPDPTKVEPVIEHMQASRWTRLMINNNPHLGPVTRTPLPRRIVRGQ